MVLVRGLTSLALLLAASRLVMAAPAEPVKAQKQDLEAIQSQVRRLEGSLRSGREAVASISSELSRLEKLLKLQALEIQLSTIEFEKLEEHVQEVTLRRDSLQQSIAERKKRLRGMLSYLPAIETRSPISRLSENDASYLAQYREMVSRILKADRAEILGLRKILLDVESLNLKLADERERLLAHTEDLREKQAVLELNQKMRKDLLSKTRAEQSDLLKSFQAAKAAEGELEGMLSRFNLAQEVRRQAEAKAAAEAAESKAEELVAEAAPKRGLAFVSRKGLLDLPVEGRVVTTFGRRYDSKTSLYTFHKGIDIQTPPDAPVKAVYPGKVVYSGKIGGYGQLLILDHGDQYFSLVGHLGSVMKKEGDDVKQGETIARSASDSTPVYFEIRQRHIAVNPVPWLANKGASQAKF